MSNNLPALPPVNEASQTIMDRVYQSQFFAKLASRGYAPRNPQEAMQALKIAGRLRNLSNDETIKAAEASDSIFSVAEAHLDAAAAGGLPGHSELAVKLAASELMNDPEIYAASLSILNAHAQQSA